jgi:hypothetical protein
MQRVHIGTGKALCRFCGEQISTNQLSVHIAKEHPRKRTDMAPTLVPKKGGGTKPRSSK